MSTVIIHVELPEIQVRKAIKVEVNKSMKDFIALISKKLTVNLEKSAVYRKIENNYSQIYDGLENKDIRECSIVDQEVLYIFSKDYLNKSAAEPQTSVAPQVKRSNSKLPKIALWGYKKTKKLLQGSMDSSVSLPERRVFGMPLKLVMSKNYCEIADNGIPLFLENAIRSIEMHNMKTEGIFRLSGMSSIILQLKEKIDKGENVNFNEIDCHVTSGLIKLFMRELPEPVLTFKLFPAFKFIIQRVNDQKLMAKYFRSCIQHLPLPNQLLLKRLLGFFLKLNSFEQDNKMTLANIATVIGPNLLKQKDESTFEIINNTHFVNHVAMCLIKHYKDIIESTEPVAFIGIALALYGFTETESKAENNLHFNENDIIFVTKINNDTSWWEGEINGKYGYFPSNYISLLEKIDEIPNTFFNQTNSSCETVSESLVDDDINGSNLNPISRTNTLSSSEGENQMVRTGSGNSSLLDVNEKIMEVHEKPTEPEGIEFETLISKDNDESASFPANKVSLSRVLKIEIKRRQELEQIVNILAKNYETLLEKVALLELKSGLKLEDAKENQINSDVENSPDNHENESTIVRDTNLASSFSVKRKITTRGRSKSYVPT